MVTAYELRSAGVARGALANGRPISIIVAVSPAPGQVRQRPGGRHGWRTLDGRLPLVVLLPSTRLVRRQRGTAGYGCPVRDVELGGRDGIVGTDSCAAQAGCGGA